MEAHGSDVARVGLFAAAAFVLISVPGPNLVYIVTRGISMGRRAAVVSALGVETGTFVHVGAAVGGVSALIASSAVAYALVRYLGAAYLIFLGIRALRSREVGEGAEAGPAARSTASLYLHGLVVNVLNPKVALFFLAFLPQFVDRREGALPQMLVLGAVFVAIAVVVDLAYALASGSLGRWLRSRSQFARWQRRISGAVYIGLGGAAALAQGTPTDSR